MGKKTNPFYELYSNLAQFGKLSKEQRTFLERARDERLSNVLRLCPSGTWQPLHKSGLDNDRVYRLRETYKIKPQIVSQDLYINHIKNDNQLVIFVYLTEPVDSVRVISKVTGDEEYVWSQPYE